MKSRQTLGFAIAIALGAAACGGSDQPARNPDQTTTTGASANNAAPSDTSSVVPTQNGAMNNTQTQTQPQPIPQDQQPTMVSLSDAQIAAITDAANSSEIDQAKLALRKAKDPQVKAFAQMMIDHHGEAKKKQHAMLSSMNISPEQTPTSTQIASDGQSAMSSLSGQSGADFDKAYIDLQIKEHKDVLNAFDTKLIPSAHNADLKKALSDFRPKVADHLQRAQDLQQKLTTK